MDRLPIELVTSGNGIPVNPLKFRWRHKTNTLNGPVVQDCEGGLPLSVEGAVANLISIAKRLMKENEELWARLEEAGKKATQQVPIKGGKR